MKYRSWSMIGHILKQDRNNDCNIAISRAQEGKNKRGRPKTAWRRTVDKERIEIGWRSREEMTMIAADREQRKTSVKALLCHDVPGSTRRIGKRLPKSAFISLVILFISSLFKIQLG